jgi:hypothetical protein
MPFDRNVFINCPFDDDYLPMLRPLLFTVIFLGFDPCIASGELNSGQPRIHKIIALIVKSKFAIHDLSRIQARRKGEYFRLNMPFEIGLDIGCQSFKGGKWKQKKCLILEVEPYRYQAAISDLSNSDIASHGGKPSLLVREVRNWLNAQASLNAPGPAHVWERFNAFMAWNYKELKAMRYSDKDIAQLPVAELMAGMKRWSSDFPWTKRPT